MPKLLVAALSMVLLSGCGLFLHQEPTEWEQAVERMPSTYVVDGEIRDGKTLALVRDAVIEISTDIEGYEPLTTVDEGQFHIRVDALRKRNSTGEQFVGGILFDDVHAGEITVGVVAYRARSGTRCSPTRREAVTALPRDPIILWLHDCSERQLAARP